MAVAAVVARVRAEHLRSLDDGRTLGDVLGQGVGGLVADEAVTQARHERVHALLVQHRELGQLIADLRRKQRSSGQPAHQERLAAES